MLRRASRRAWEAEAEAEVPQQVAVVDLVVEGAPRPLALAEAVGCLQVATTQLGSQREGSCCPWKTADVVEP